MAQHGGGWPAWPKFIKVAFGYVVLLVNVSILLRCASVARQDISAHGIWSQPGELSQKVPHERWPRPRRRWPHNDGEANEGVQRKVDFRQVQVLHGSAIREHGVGGASATYVSAGTPGKLMCTLQLEPHISYPIHRSTSIAPLITLPGLQKLSVLSPLCHVGKRCLFAGSAANESLETRCCVFGPSDFSTAFACQLPSKSTERRAMMCCFCRLPTPPPEHRPAEVGFLPPVWRQAVVSVYEIGGLAYYFMRLLVAAWRACRTHGGQWEDLYNSWEATVYIYWDLIPSVRTFSALRALKHVHPQLFPAELRSAHLKYSMRLRSCRQRFAMISLFVIKRIVILWFGLQAFMHKFTQTAAQLEMNEGRPLTQMFLGIVFLNQLVGGVVQMDIQFRNRLMLFLFGGEDAKVEPEEDALLNVWVAHVANALWQRAFCLNDDAALDPVAISTFKGATPKERRMTALERLLCWIRWVVAISDFNHIDLQKAVLCEGEEHRQRRNEILGSRSIDHNAISFLD
ncbi:unnamed protein product [Prorocentrum cordatum]|uniref:Autophagy-related protein 9 n=1 Tax=Prorocentrum cordatum TaxID=2364126 RepID=A0ABN9QAF6_9DINO|nr:unnamed protein product [Polarella glacialis]